MLIIIGRKMLLAGNGQIMHKEYEHPFVPDFERLKKFTWNSTKKIGHLSLVTTLRIYIKSSNMIKARYNRVRAQMNKASRKNGGVVDPAQKAEASKFLKMMSDYKQKIRDIKHRIHEEENNS